MLRTMAVLLAMGAAAFYFLHQEAPPHHVSQPPEKAVMRDASALRDLKKKIPGVLFDKDVAPIIRQNDASGLTPSETAGAAKRLREIGSALGFSARSCIEDALAKFAPELPREKGLAEKAADWAGNAVEKAGEGLKDGMPALGRVLEDILSVLVTLVSGLLDQAAGLFRK